MTPSIREQWKKLLRWRPRPPTFVAITLGFCIYVGCVHELEPTHVGIRRNLFTGRVTLDTRAGFFLTLPWVAVARIDTRPTRVCITSVARSFNCKLVQFVPEAYREFVAVQGFRYYWLANRLSFNNGYDEEYRGMRDILRGFAFGNRPPPFLRVITTY